MPFISATTAGSALKGSTLAAGLAAALAAGFAAGFTAALAAVFAAGLAFASAANPETVSSAAAAPVISILA
ncbi:MAG: hypothetical protein E7048_00390 [Lentisphaerae bacterium]|nr:hypothetical protein [Lentisphaerota bacterium]